MALFLRQFFLVFGREFRALLSQPLYYVLTGIFALLTSLVYLSLLIDFARGGAGSTVNVTDSVVRQTFHMVHFFLLVQVPLLTMRLVAEERAGGMLDLLQASPLGDWALVLGKFAATCLGLLLYLAFTALYPGITSLLGEVEWPVVFGSLLALALSAAAYSAVGMFFSSVTESQVVAAVLSYVTLFLLVFVQPMADALGVPALQDASRHFSVLEHVGAFLSGNVALMNSLYYPCLGILFLFLTARQLEARRWRS